MPLMFKIMFGLSGFTVVTSIVRRMQLTQYINRLSSCDDGKKGEILGRYKAMIRLYKILFLLCPFYIIITYLICKYGGDGIYMISTMIIVYVLILEDYFFRKKLLDKLDK